VTRPPAKPGEDPIHHVRLLLSTVVIFVAKLGDKSQLIAMTFAAGYRARDVLIGIAAATAIVHLASPRPGS
jgi:putative Ca2+/H+ antiporter (TMEM165/GDT1 family)